MLAILQPHLGKFLTINNGLPYDNKTPVCTSLFYPGVAAVFVRDSPNMHYLGDFHILWPF